MQQYPGYILDLDGTVYLGGDLIPGADRTVARLRARGARVTFLSNNPARTPAQYAEKLVRLGIPAVPDDVVNSMRVLIEELQREAPAARLYVIGERPLLVELERAGFKTAASPSETDFVILAFDRTFHYGKLLFAHRAASNGARIWATNPDRACPVPGGDIPDCAAVIGAVEGSTGRKVERIVGKPSATMLAAAARRLDLPASECLLVGDRIETDILMARNAGCPSALVLTGVTKPEMLPHPDIRPDHVLETIAKLP